MVYLLFYILPIVCGSLFMSLFCYALLFVHSSFAIILKRKFAFICLQLSCYCKGSMAPPHGALGWSAVCGCDISWSYSLTF